MNIKNKTILRDISCWFTLICFVLAVWLNGQFYLGVFFGILIALATYLPE